VDESAPVPDPNGLELQGLAVLLQRLARDHHALIDGLARSIGAAMPDAVEVGRRGLLNTGRAHTLKIHLGDESFELHDQRGQLAASIGKSVGGIVVSHADASIDDWLARLFAALQASAERSTAIAAALSRLS